MQQGWISLHRKILEHPFFQEKRSFSKFEAWIDLLLLANHKDNKFILGNELIEVERGSFITSELKLMDRWGWSKTKVRSFLKLLENDSMIVKKSDTKKTTITLCNYNDYQESETTKEPQKNRKETAREPQKDTNNNVNNDNNVNNENKKDSPRKSKPTYDIDSDEMKLVDFFISEIRKNNPDFRDPNKQTWSHDFKLIIVNDKRDKKEVSQLIRWVQQDDFEKANVLSPAKLRKRYDNLVMKMKAPPKQRFGKKTEQVPDYLTVQGKHTPLLAEQRLEEPIDFEVERQKILRKLGR